MTSIESAFIGGTAMSTKLKSPTTISREGQGDFVARRLPRHRPPTHPGQMLHDEFLVPLGITQSELAAQLRVSFPRLNEIVRGKRGVTPDTALRLARVVGMSADFWLGLQQDWDLWHAIHSNQAAEIKRLKPLDRTGKGKAAQKNEG
jgi:addiction module HigA family antidote